MFFLKYKGFQGPGSPPVEVDGNFAICFNGSSGRPQYRQTKYLSSFDAAK